MEHVGTMIRRRRQQLGLTLSQLAASVGCAKSYLSGIETGGVKNPPSMAIVRRLAAALRIAPGQLERLADWQSTPVSVKADYQRLAAERNQIAALLRQSVRPLSELMAGGGGADGAEDVKEMKQARPAMAGAINGSPGGSRVGGGEGGAGSGGGDGGGGDDSGGGGQLPDGGDWREWGELEMLGSPCLAVPLINRLAAGLPADFTDLDYPAGVADEYLQVPAAPDLDAAAFATRITGLSMYPEYEPGDVVVFSTLRDATEGSDCFVRLLPDHQITFKRIFFLPGDVIELRPLNGEFQARRVHRTRISGLFPALYKIRPVGARS